MEGSACFVFLRLRVFLLCIFFFYFLRFIFALQTFRTLIFRQKSYEYNNFVIILKSHLYPFARNGRLKHHLTCNSFFYQKKIYWLISNGSNSATRYTPKLRHTCIPNNCCWCVLSSHAYSSIL